MTVVAHMRGDARDLVKATGKASGAIHGLATSGEKSFNRLAVGATKAAVGIGGIATVAAVAAGNVYDSFSKVDLQVRRVWTLLPQAGERAFKRMEEQTRDFAVRFGNNAEDVARAFYQAFSAGAITYSNAIRGVEAALKSTMATGVLPEKAAQFFQQTANAFQITAQRAADLSFEVARLGVTEIPLLVTHLSKVAPIAKDMGISLEQTGAALVTLTRYGVPTAQATTQLGRLYLEAGDISKELGKNLKEEFGSSFKELIASGEDPVSIIYDYWKRVGDEEFIVAFGEINAYQAGSKLKDLFKEYHVLKADVTDAAGALNDAFAKVAGSDFHVLQTFKSTGKELSFRFAEHFREAMRPTLQNLTLLMLGMSEDSYFVQGVNTFADTMTKASQLMSDVAPTFASLAAALSPITQGVGGFFGGLISGFDTGFQGIAADITQAAREFSDAGKRIGDILEGAFGNTSGLSAAINGLTTPMLSVAESMAKFVPLFVTLTNIIGSIAGVAGRGAGAIDNLAGFGGAGLLMWMGGRGLNRKSKAALAAQGELMGNFRKARTAAVGTEVDARTKAALNTNTRQTTNVALQDVYFSSLMAQEAAMSRAMKDNELRGRRIRSRESMYMLRDKHGILKRGVNDPLRHAAYLQDKLDYMDKGQVAALKQQQAEMVRHREMLQKTPWKQVPLYPYTIVPPGRSHGLGNHQEVMKKHQARWSKGGFGPRYLSDRTRIVEGFPDPYALEKKAHAAYSAKYRPTSQQMFMAGSLGASTVRWRGRPSQSYKPPPGATSTQMGMGAAVAGSALAKPATAGKLGMIGQGLFGISRALPMIGMGMMFAPMIAGLFARGPSMSQRLDRIVQPYNEIPFKGKELSGLGITDDYLHRLFTTGSGTAMNDLFEDIAVEGSENMREVIAQADPIGRALIEGMASSDKKIREQTASLADYMTEKLSIATDVELDSSVLKPSILSAAVAEKNKEMELTGLYASMGQILAGTHEIEDAITGMGALRDWVGLAGNILHGEKTEHATQQAAKARNYISDLKRNKDDVLEAVIAALDSSENRAIEVSNLYGALESEGMYLRPNVVGYIIDSLRLGGGRQDRRPGRLDDILNALDESDVSSTPYRNSKVSSTFERLLDQIAEKPLSSFDPAEIDWVKANYTQLYDEALNLYKDYGDSVGLSWRSLNQELYETLPSYSTYLSHKLFGTGQHASLIDEYLRVEPGQSYAFLNAHDYLKDYHTPEGLIEAMTEAVKNNTEAQNNNTDALDNDQNAVVFHVNQFVDRDMAGY